MAPRRWARSAPPWKIGAVRPDARLQIVLEVVNSVAVDRASCPTDAERVIDGYIAAVATPIAALAAWSDASAARMSGRWWTSSDGSVSGRSPGSERSARSKSGGVQSAGNWPTRTEKACRAALSCWRSGGSCVRSLAS